MPLAHLPTPLEFADRLTDAWAGPRIWIKRDDLTGFGLSGNKVRKLEFHFAAAHAAGAETVITCGAVQSNHCRATAIAAARCGMKAILLLRSADGQPPPAALGNHLLQLLAGAEVRFITPDEWTRRDELMQEVVNEYARRGEPLWSMPAGASDRLGMAAFDAAMEELLPQLTAHGLPEMDRRLTVWHASSSGGTTAGIAAGAARLGLSLDVVGTSVGESAAEMHEAVMDIFTDAGVATADAPAFEVLDEWRGAGYGLTSPEELDVQVAASRLTGMIWDPTYTGKAVYALQREIDRGRFTADDDVIFWHTGGGFAAFAHDFSTALAS